MLCLADKSAWLALCLQDYANLFRQQIVHIPEMHEND